MPASATDQWIDTHCHLDAPEWDGLAGGVQAERAAARAAGVGLCVLPAVNRAGFTAVRDLALTMGDAYALGIHPLFVPQADEADLDALDAALLAHRDDPRLVAVGEIGLDFFVPELCTPAMRERQWHFYRAQLGLAQRHGLPVILHVRRSADWLLKGLRQCPVVGGIAHAFNGSDVQAQAFVDRGFKLGFGGAMTFDTARRLRHLAQQLPDSALVLETDAPDIPPHWLYVTAAERAAGRPQGINGPSQLPRIAAVMAELRATTPESLMRQTSANAQQALPKLAACWGG
jgi:TatD DNase family protein